MAPELDALINDSLPVLVQALIQHQKLKQAACRVDGLIIGTGEADFTKGTTTYTLNCQNKTFQLLDAPGIEGDEARFVAEVHKAIAQAHLVFYVNGTNKKPEKATAEKIASYLKRGTQVCPLINVRGNADAYEFEEDREALEHQGGATSALQQTTDVLKSVLDPDVLLPGKCVQGLLAFSALAYDPATSRTRIHPQRNRDLVIQQRNYLKHFGSPEAMYEFSQIRHVAKVVHDKLETFQDDIVESNKKKLLASATDYLHALREEYQGHQHFVTSVEPEFEKCRVAFTEAIKTFERMVLTGRKNAWNVLFNKLVENADNIIEEHFGNPKRIKGDIEDAYAAHLKDLDTHLQARLDKHLGVLQEQLKQASVRLIEDVHRLEIEQHAQFEENRTWKLKDGLDLSRQLGLSDLGSMAFQIGSYAVAGFTIGTSFPIIGNVIGTAIGAALGLVMTAVTHVLGNDRRIRKVQLKVRESLEEVREETLSKLSQEVGELVMSIEKEVSKGPQQQVNHLRDSLLQPLTILEQQISLISQFKTQLEAMPYGTIQTVHY